MFKPGDEVECVRSRFGISEGKIFTVAAICYPGDQPVGFDCPIVPAVAASIQLNELPWQQGIRNGCWFWGYSASAFRKVQRRNLTEWLAQEATFNEPKRIKEKA